MSMKAVFAVDADDALRAHLRSNVRQDVELVFPISKAKEEVLAAADGASAVVGIRYLEEILHRNAGIRLVQVPWAGVEGPAAILRDHPDVLLANSHANAYATAQYGVSMLLALVNQLVPAHQLMVGGWWRARGEMPAPDLLRGKTAGILGAGHIGRAAARILRALEMRTLGFRRRRASASDPFDTIFGRDDLDDVLRASDILFVALPGTQETWHLIGDRELDLLGDEGYLVNIGRGEVVKEAALFEALKERRIAGAAIDVWYDYHPEADESGFSFPSALPYHELENVVLSPHRAGNARPSLSDWDVVIENLNRIADGRTDLLNLVDIERGY